MSEAPLPPSDMDVAEGQPPTTRRPKRTPDALLLAATTHPNLDAEETGVYIGVGTSTAYRLIANGTIPSFQIPGTHIRRVRRVVLEQLVQQWSRNGNGRRRRKPEVG